MANTTLKFGNGNWAIKKDSALAYSDQYDNYKPLPFDFARASNGTIVNKSGLIESVNSGLPRIDFSYSTDGGLLLEPQSTNLITYSSDLSSLNLRSNAVVTSNEVISPSGDLDADKITFDGTFPGRVEQTIAATVGQPYTISVYLKNKDLSDVSQVWIGFSTAAQGQFVTITDEWQRYDITTNADGTSEYPRIQFSGTGSLYAWGFQVEQQSHATSYIPTSGASSTRVVDFSNGFNLNPQQEGLIPSNSPFTFFSYVNINLGTPSVGNGFYFTENNSTAVYYYGSTMMIRSATGEEYSSIPSGLHKIAISYDGSRAKLFIDGSKTEDVNASSRFANINNMNFYRNNSNSSFEFNDLRLFNEALSDEELQKLTTI